MLFVVLNKRNGKYTVCGNFDNDSLDTAIAFGESVAMHQKGYVTVELINKQGDKPLVLKKIKTIRKGFFGMRKEITVK